MKRNIKQIAAGTTGQTSRMRLFALADDGSIWIGRFVHGMVETEGARPGTKTISIDDEFSWLWEQLPALPDDNGNLSKVAP